MIVNGTSLRHGRVNYFLVLFFFGLLFVFAYLRDRFSFYELGVYLFVTVLIIVVGISDIVRSGLWLEDDCLWVRRNTFSRKYKVPYKDIVGVELNTNIEIVNRSGMVFLFPGKVKGASVMVDKIKQHAGIGGIKPS